MQKSLIEAQERRLTALQKANPQVNMLKKHSQSRYHTKYKQIQAYKKCIRQLEKASQVAKYNTHTTNNYSCFCVT